MTTTKAWLVRRLWWRSFFFVYSATRRRHGGTAGDATGSWLARGGVGAALCRVDTAVVRVVGLVVHDQLVIDEVEAIRSGLIRVLDHLLDFCNTAVTRAEVIMHSVIKKKNKTVLPWVYVQLNHCNSKSKIYLYYTYVEFQLTLCLRLADKSAQKS